MSDVKRLLTRQDIIDSARLGARLGLNASADIGAQAARGYAPVDTTRLSASISRSEVEEIGAMSFQVVWGTNVEYASAHEFGSGIHDPSGPHTILIEAGIFTGKSEKRALAFVWPGAPEKMKQSTAYDAESGKFLFARIHHPGVKATPFLRPSLNLGTGSREAAAEKLRSLTILAMIAELRRRKGG